MASGFELEVGLTSREGETLNLQGPRAPPTKSSKWVSVAGRQFGEEGDSFLERANHISPRQHHICHIR